MSAMRLTDHPLTPEPVNQPVALIGGEPMRFLGTVGQVEHHHQPQQNRRHTLADEQPLPARQPPYPVEPEDPA